MSATLLEESRTVYRPAQYLAASEGRCVARTLTVQYLSIRYSERLKDAGVQASAGTTGDSYDNAMAKIIIGLFKAEVIHARGP
jgi:transposase InsO family protein